MPHRKLLGLLGHSQDGYLPAADLADQHPDGECRSAWVSRVCRPISPTPSALACRVAIAVTSRSGAGCAGRARTGPGSHRRAHAPDSSGDGLNGKEFAARLGWSTSKLSGVETGKQTPTGVDIAAWTSAAGQP